MTEIIVALDVNTLAEERRILRRLRGAITHYKIGLRLFIAQGRRAVDLVHRQGGRVFLDLKLMDIPQTAAHAVEEAHGLGVFALSLHLWGGAEMLRAAARVRPRPQLWGVAALTSLSAGDLRIFHPRTGLDGVLERAAGLARIHRLDGIICSARDVPRLRPRLGPRACFITPGIRPAGHGRDDQKRVATPAQAAELGVRYLVVGRPVTRAPDPLRAVQELQACLRRGSRSRT